VRFEPFASHKSYEVAIGGRVKIAFDHENGDIIVEVIAAEICCVL